MKGHILKVFLLFLPFIFLTACASQEYYKDRATNRARDYVFEQVPKISPQNAAFIKYTYPKFEIAPIYTNAGTSDISNYYWNYGNDYYNPVTYSKKTTFNQTAIVWDLPSPKVSLMVIGACTEGFQSWEPFRLLIRKTESKTQAESELTTNSTTDTQVTLPMPKI